MKYETNRAEFYRRSRFVWLIPAFLFLSISVFSQKIQVRDSVLYYPFSVPPINIHDIRLSVIYPYLGTYDRILPFADPERTRTTIFLDTLKIRASKSLVTRKLYDFLVTSREPSTPKTITSSSDQNFLDFSGRKIRKIEIQRLEVFGSNLKNPAIYSPNGIERLLNKTHINTNENIIRKNLLFAVGDSVSPLTLSDNERLLRELPFINDARIIVIPASDNEVDILVLTKDVYSLGAKASFSSLKKGSFSVFEKNVFGMGHEFKIEVPYDSRFNDSPGFGIRYNINNINKTFANLGLFYYDGLGKKNYGFDLSRKLVSSATKYAGGISVEEMFTTEDLDSMTLPASLKYNLQDYWIQRSFLLNEANVTRLILGARYKNNNVFDHPDVLPDSYQYLQQSKIFLGSVSLSMQKFYKANLIYGYGRTEDIPYGGLIDITYGREISEFKKRNYLSTSFSMGRSIKSTGYIYGSAGFGTFFNNGHTEQGMLLMRTSFISNLSYLGRSRIRFFAKAEYIRGFDRYSDEKLIFRQEDGFSGFRSDSVVGTQRVFLGLESVVFSPVIFYGFRFAYYGFADFGFLFGTNDFIGNGDYLSAIGIGIRLRNDNLVFNTLQIRLGFFPNLPPYSRINHLLVSGEQLLKPEKFEPAIPSLLPYK